MTVGILPSVHQLTELDASGTFVNGHVVTSFASADMNWSESRITVQNTTYTQVGLRGKLCAKYAPAAVHSS